MLGLPLTRASVEPDRKDLLTTFFCGCAERRPATADASTIGRVNVCFDRGWAFDNGGALPQNFAMSFITFEGSEVCGKSTQVKPLAAFFEACHLDIRVIGNLNGFAMSIAFPISPSSSTLIERRRNGVSAIARRFVTTWKRSLMNVTSA